MENYALTQADIDRLIELGFNMNAVAEGTLALEPELEALGKMPTTPPVETSPLQPASADLPYDPSTFLPPDTPVEEQVIDAPAAPAPAPAAMPAAAPAAAPAASPAMGANMMGLLNLMQPVPQDPFENLSRRQRTMLGFAALRDAGMALQGREGGAVQGVMSDITARADMERKRQAALARQQMLGQLTGGAAGGGMNRQAIINAMAMGAIDGPTGTAMLSELERQSGVSQDIAGKEMMIGQIDALLFDPELGRALGIEGFLRTPFAQLGLDTDTARVKARIDQIKGGAFLEAYKSLRGGGQITELEGQKAEEAQARFSTAQNEEDFRDALMEYKFYIDQGIRRLNGEQIPPDTIYSTEEADPLNIR